MSYRERITNTKSIEQVLVTLLPANRGCLNKLRFIQNPFKPSHFHVNMLLTYF